MCLSLVRGNNSYVEARPESEKLKRFSRYISRHVVQLEGPECVEELLVVARIRPLGLKRQIWVPQEV